MRKLALLCMVCLGTSLALAQAPVVVQNPGGTSDTNTAAKLADREFISPTKAELPVQDAYIADDTAFPPPPHMQFPLERDRRPGEQCRSDPNDPNSFLCGQNDATVANTWNYDDLWFYNPDILKTGRIVCIYFPPPGQPDLTGPIGTVNWYGTYITYPTNDTCTKPHHFQIKFYSGTLASGPQCNTPIYTWSGVPSKVDMVGRLDFGVLPMAYKYRFTVVLDPPAPVIASGWFSVASDYNQQPCHHLIGPTNEGILSYWRYWITDMPACGANMGAPGIAYCLLENRSGVCCDDRGCSYCDPNSDEFACRQSGGRFAASPTTCQTLNPPCGHALGACCYDEGTCAQKEFRHCEICIGDTNCDCRVDFADINPFVQALSYPAGSCNWRNADCNGDGLVNFADINCFVARLGAPDPNCHYLTARTTGPIWLGPGSVCSSCCTVLAEPNKPQENEPNDCAPDTFNAGCNSWPATWKEITCPTIIYGESGTFGGTTRDMDWYRYTLPAGQNATFTWTVRAEFDVVIWIIKPGTCDPNDPNSFYTIDYATGDKCTDVSLTSRCLAPGKTYAFVVAPQAFDGVICGSDYRAELTCTTGCTLCSVTCPGGALQEAETPCGADTNGGCNSTPYAFEALPDNFGNPPATLCGTLWNNGTRRDTDWYKIRYTDPCGFWGWEWHVTTEVPIRATALFDYRDNQIYPPPQDCSTYYYWVETLFAPCTPGSFDAGVLYSEDPMDPNRPYWFLVMPEDSGGPLFDGYPCGTCGTNENDYVITFTIFPGLCWPHPCHSWPTTLDEGEPNCFDGYNDTFNGTCNAASVISMIEFEAYCGRSGTYQTIPGDPNTATADIDWWKIIIPPEQNAMIHILTIGEFSYNLEFYAAPCPGTLLERHMVDPWILVDITSFCYAPGDYYVRIVPTSVPACGKKYVLQYELTNANCTPCINLACPGGGIQEQEACGADTNGGCLSSPYVFEDFGPDPNNACGKTMCGTLWATGGSRDLDWYRVKLPTGTTGYTVVPTVDTEVPLVVFWFYGTPLGSPPSCAVLSNYQWTDILTCTTGEDLTELPCMPPGEYWLVPAPAGLGGSGIWENYPCGSLRNDYWITLNCTPGCTP